LRKLHFVWRPSIRDRIVEFRRVPARELLPHASNWRRHPPAQRKAIEGVLAEVGWADAVLAYETDDGLRLIDGHLGSEVAPDAEIPVLRETTSRASAETRA